MEKYRAKEAVGKIKALEKALKEAEEKALEAEKAKKEAEKAKEEAEEKAKKINVRMERKLERTRRRASCALKSLLKDDSDSSDATSSSLDSSEAWEECRERIADWEALEAQRSGD